MEERETSSEGFWDRPLQSPLQQLQATPAGLTADEAQRRLRSYGPNSMVPESRFAGLLGFLRPFGNPLVVILLVASGVSLGLGDDIDGLIIIATVLSTACAKPPEPLFAGGHRSRDCNDDSRRAKYPGSTL